MIRRRLFRRTMTTTLAHIAKEWDRLSYPRFIIQAESILNPEHQSDPMKNFSKAESVFGWLTPRNVPWASIRTFIDDKRRPDKYALIYADSQRRRWNEDPAHYPEQIYVLIHKVVESIKATRRKPEVKIEVGYPYIQTLRGGKAVGQVDKHLSDGQDGLQQVRERIQTCRSARLVDRGIENVLEENRAIQFGGSI